MPTRDSALVELDDLLRELQQRLATTDDGDEYFRGTDVDKSAIHARLHAAIDRWSVQGDTYQRNAAAIEARNASTGWKAIEMLGVLRALRDDYEAGYMRSVEELVQADLFSDLLEMAKELLDKGMKDPGAVLAGSVLEEHLRKLAGSVSVPIVDANGRHRKADGINAELAKAGVYNKLEQKSVTAWLDLRNHAAHGEYEEYDYKQVASLIDSVRDFLLRHPA